MSTKTMRLPPRRVLMSSNNKRKEGDGFDSVITPSVPNKSLKPTPAPHSQAGSQPAQPSNQLLAGYLAHEFLTKGTLFGEPWDPARAEAVPVSSKAKPQPSLKAEPDNESHKIRYMEISSLLKTNGAHLPGIVNPAQLARLLQM